MDSNIRRTQKIYIELEDEGTEVWRPTNAVILGNGLFEVLPTPEYDPEDEKWKFPPGSIVRLIEKRSGSELISIAVAIE